MKESKAVITKIGGPSSLKSFLLSQGIVEGVEFEFNYSPVYSGLVNLSIDNRMISMRKNDFNQIEWEWKA